MIFGLYYYVKIEIPSIYTSIPPRNLPSENPRSLTTSVPSSITSRYSSQSPRKKPSSIPPVVPSVYPSGDPRSVPPYVKSVNPYRTPNEQEVRDIKEEMQTPLEQVKSLENIIAPGKIKVDEAAQLHKLYINKLKRGICMLDTNVNKFSEEKKAHVYLKQKAKEIISEKRSKIAK